MCSHFAVCASLRWLLTNSTCHCWSYTFSNLIFLPEGYFTSNICSSPSPPLSTSENSRCVSFLVAVIIHPHLTDLYPRWLILYPSCSTTGSCNITISAPPSIHFSNAIIVGSYPLLQLCIMHFTIASWWFLESLFVRFDWVSFVLNPLGFPALFLLVLHHETSFQLLPLLDLPPPPHLESADILWQCPWLPWSAPSRSSILFSPS